MPCPECRHAFQIPENEVAALPEKTYTKMLFNVFKLV